MTERDSEQPLAREDIVLFVEETSTGDRTLVGCGGGNFTAPAEIASATEDLLAQMVPIDDVELGTKVGIVRVLGRGLQKQITVHAEVDESVTREDYDYDPDAVTADLDTIRDT